MVVCKKCTLQLVCKSGLLSLTVTFLIAGWYWIQHGEELWSYFIMNSFGMNADVWKLPGGIREHILYYFQGPVLQSNLGFFTIPVLAIFFGGAFWNIGTNKNHEDRIIGASLCIMVSGIYGIFFLQGIKNEYMGGVLYIFLLFGALYYLSQLIRYVEMKWDPNPFLGCFCAVVITALFWSLYRYPETEKVNPLWASINKSMTLRLLDDLSVRITNQPSRIVFSQATPIISEYVTMMLGSQSKKIIVESCAWTKNLTDAIASLPRYDYIVLQDPGMEGRPGFTIPSEAWSYELRKYLDKQSEWTLVNRYPSVDKKNAYLYGRSSLMNKSGPPVTAPKG
jgi:hypothetical protein